MEAAQFGQFVSIQLSKKRKTPLYIQLADQLAYRIREGKLAPGLPLPPVRHLASLLSINPATAAAAYKELERNGLIMTRRGSGSIVSDSAALPQISLSLTEDAPSPGTVDMSRITPDPRLFPMDTFKDIIGGVIERDGPFAFSYSESQGWRPLRESIAATLAGEGIHTDPDLIQIVSGAQQGIDIAARALLRHGDYAVTEDPTYPGAAASFRALGARILGIPLTPSGIEMDRLEEGVSRFAPRLFYLMPDVQNPTGLSYAPSIKGRLMGLAGRSDFYILEDDYLGGLATGAGRSLKSMDRNDRVIYLRSISSLFIPGFRLAFLVMPERLAPILRKVKYLTDIATSGLTQRIFDLYLRRRLWDAHVATLRQVFSDRRAFALSLARRHLPPDVLIQPSSIAPSLWLTLPGSVSSKDIAAKGKEAGFAFTDGAPFFLREGNTAHLRISFASASLPDMEKGFALLGSLCRGEALS